MVLGVLTAVGVTFIAGYVARGLIAGAPDEDHEDEHDRRVRLQRRLKELEKARSGSGCCYFFILFLLFGFLIALGSILYATNFFRSRKALSTLWLDWNYWLNYDYKIFNYNYSGIAGVAVTVILVVFPLLMILCKLCWDVRRHEKELKETREELERVQQDRRVGGDVAYAQGGYVNIAIADCFNVHCTCYVTLVFTATPVAFLSVVIFVCYVLYTYLSK